MTDNYKSLENEAHAIHITEEEVHKFYVGESMFKLGYLIEGVKCKLIDISRSDLVKENSHLSRKKWINEGVDVEVLKVGSLGWQQGKLRLKISVEFCPNDELN